MEFLGDHSISPASYSHPVADLSRAGLQRLRLSRRPRLSRARTVAASDGPTLAEPAETRRRQDARPRDRTPVPTKRQGSA